MAHGLGNLSSEKYSTAPWTTRPDFKRSAFSLGVLVYLRFSVNQSFFVKMLKLATLLFASLATAIEPCAQVADLVTKGKLPTEGSSFVFDDVELAYVSEHRLPIYQHN